MHDFLDIVGIASGRCFKWVNGHDAEPTSCRNPPLSTGWTAIGGRWCHLDACSGHSGELRFRGPFVPDAHTGTTTYPAA